MREPQSLLQMVLGYERGKKIEIERSSCPVCGDHPLTMLKFFRDQEALL